MRIVEFIKQGLGLVGWFGTINDNELEINSTMADPVKLRFAIHENKVESNLGGVSFNRSRDDGQHHEDALLMGRMTPDKKGGAVYIAVRPANGNDHEDVREVFYIDGGAAVFQVPIFAPGLGGGGNADRMAELERRIAALESRPGGTSTHAIGLKSPGGQVSLELQGNERGEGALVLYDIRDPTRGRAIGQIPIQKL